MLTLLYLVTAVFCVSWSGTWLVRRYALKRSILDIPNQRSSHVVPTPRGGGVAIVLSFIIALPVVFWGGWIDDNAALALGGAGCMVAFIGFLDDHRHVPARWRLLVHAVAASWALYWLGGLPATPIGDTLFQWGWLGLPIGLLYLVWMLNLYNFMDGIDGIAGVEALTSSISVVLICGLLGRWQEAVLPLLLAVSVAGFLFWNFPPAKIFMGDAGSGFLGLLVGLLSLQMAWVDPQLVWIWLILLGVFLVDASVTLLRRLVRGVRVYEAHREHAYQHASRRFKGHRPVTLAVAMINLFWLLPLASWAALKGDIWLVLPLAYAPLIWLAFKYHAGLAE